MSSNLLRKYKEEPRKLTPEEKEKLILEYAPLIKFIAQKIAVRLPSNIEFDDLVSSGVIGLMDAIDKYDPPRDSRRAARPGLGAALGTREGEAARKSARPSRAAARPRPHRGRDHQGS